MILRAPGGLLLIGYVAYSFFLAPIMGWFSDSDGVKQPDALSKTQSILVELGPDDRIEEIESLLKKYGATFEKAFPDVTMEETEDLAQYYLVSAPNADLKESTS
jgi:hypothetical protein